LPERRPQWLDGITGGLSMVARATPPPARCGQGQGHRAVRSSLPQPRGMPGGCAPFIVDVFV
jgi:hypothetical protein